MSQVLPSLLSAEAPHTKQIHLEQTRSLHNASSNDDDSEHLDSDRLEEKKFSCPHCDHKFTRKHNLKSHLLIHTKEKPFSCSICSSKFRRLHDLKRHEKLHTGEKPYQCKNCGRKFSRCDALVRHNNSQSGCTLLVDDSVLKHRLEEDLSPQPHTNLHALARAQQITNTSPSGLQQQQQQQQLHHQKRAIYETNHWKVQSQPQPQSQLQPRIELQSNEERSSSITSPRLSQSQQNQVNSLPSINRLTPLINQPEEQREHESSSSSPQRVENYDLLPYVKILESRVSALETKLSQTETKLAKLSYSVHNNNETRT